MTPTPGPLNTIRPASQLRAVKNLDQILYQLTNLRESWQFLNTDKKIQSLNVAADGLDDIVGLIEPFKMRHVEQPYTPNEKKLINILMAACLFAAGVLAGIEHERLQAPSSSPVNFARVGL